jgi:hypothetical protein
MFCRARQTSQGTQRIYSASNTDDHDFKITHSFHPTNGFNMYLDDYFDNNNINDIHHELSSFNDTPYLTQQATTVILSISATNEEEEHQYKEEEIDGLEETQLIH